MLLVAPGAIYGRARSCIGRVLERHLRPAQQRRCGIAVIGIDTNTARDVKIETDTGKMEARTNDTSELIRIQRRTFRAAVAGNDEELRFAEACDSIGCICILTEPPRGLLQYFISHVMSERGVDVMDITQIDENQSEVRRTRYRGDELLE